MASQRPKPPAWQPARLVHHRTEKVQEDLTWRAARLAPPAPPTRTGLTSQELSAVRESLSGALLQQSIQSGYVGAPGRSFSMQSLIDKLDYNHTYLEYVSIYETYLGHLRRLERVHQQLGRSAVAMPAESPLKKGPLDGEGDSPANKPGFGLVTVPLPQKSADKSAAARERRAAKRRRNKASRKMRRLAAAKQASTLAAEALKAEADFIRVERRTKRLRKRVAKAEKPKPKEKGAASTVPPPPADAPARPNRAARRRAIYGPPPGSAVPSGSGP